MAARYQPVVVGHDYSCFKLLQYARFTRSTVLPSRISFQHIPTNRKTREEQRTVLAHVACIIRTAELAHTVVTNSTMQTALLITNSCTLKECQVILDISLKLTTRRGQGPFGFGLKPRLMVTGPSANNSWNITPIIYSRRKRHWLDPVIPVRGNYTFLSLRKCMIC